MKNGAAALENSPACNQKFKHSYHRPAILFLGIHSREIKTYVHTKTCTQMFIAALFIMAKKWKQSKCPSTDERINKNSTSIQ